MVTQAVRAVCGLILLAILTMAIPARAATVAGPVQRCQELLPAFVTAPSRLSIETQPDRPDGATGVRLAWGLG